jgi:hypothetical protein
MYFIFTLVAFVADDAIYTPVPNSVLTNARAYLVDELLTSMSILPFICCSTVNLKEGMLSLI